MTQVRLVVPEDVKIRVVEVVREIIREQCKDGVSADGTPFPMGKDGKVLDMRHSGAMLDRLKVVGSTLQSNLPYDAIVEALYHWAGVAPQYQKKLEERLAFLKEEIVAVTQT